MCNVYVIFVTVRLLWAAVRAWYMPSCPVHVSFPLHVLLYFLNEINGDGEAVGDSKPPTRQLILQYCPYPARNGKIPLKILNLHRDPDYHQNLTRIPPSKNSSKFATTLWVILLRDKQRQKHNLLGGGNKLKMRTSGELCRHVAPPPCFLSVPLCDNTVSSHARYQSYSLLHHIDVST